MVWQLCKCIINTYLKSENKANIPLEKMLLQAASVLRHRRWRVRRIMFESPALGCPSINSNFVLYIADALLCIGALVYHVLFVQDSRALHISVVYHQHIN